MNATASSTGHRCGYFPLEEDGELLGIGFAKAELAEERCLDHAGTDCVDPGPFGEKHYLVRVRS